MVRFTTKKIDSLTLGEKLKKIRDERRLTLAEVSKSTRIQAKYLEYLEEGEYLKLPADVYVKGFLRSYAVFMGLNEKSLIKQYEREKGIHKNIKKIDDSQANRRPINFSSLVITPKMIIVSTIIILVLASFAYLYSQVNNFVSTPRLAIIKPTDGSVTSENSTHVVGVAEKDSLVSINDQPVLVNEKGEFSEDVGLKSGVNMITVKARNRFNKETTQSVNINANFPNAVPAASDDGAQSTQQDDNSKLINAEVHVSPNSVWISVQADDNLVYNGVLLPDSVQSFTAKEKISITSGKGNQTFVKINGKDLGAISSDTGTVRDVTYDANGKVASDNNK